METIQTNTLNKTRARILVLILALLAAFALWSAPARAAGPDTNPFTVTGGIKDTDYSYNAANGVLTINTDKPLTIKKENNPTEPTSATIMVNGGTNNEANITLEGVNIKTDQAERSAFAIKSGVTLNLTLVEATSEPTRNRLTSQGDKAGLNVPEDATLIVNGDSNNTSGGDLLATGFNGAAGIGGNKGENSGEIIINGGGVAGNCRATATNGVATGAGVGGGEGGTGTVTVTGGTLTGSCTTEYTIDIKSYMKGAGIGGGAGGTGTVIITGGTVDGSCSATGESKESIASGAGIGGGAGGAGIVTISGQDESNRKVKGQCDAHYGTATGAGIGGGQGADGTVNISGQAATNPNDMGGVLGQCQSGAASPRHGTEASGAGIGGGQDGAGFVTITGDRIVKGNCYAPDNAKASGAGIGGGKKTSAGTGQKNSTVEITGKVFEVFCQAKSGEASGAGIGSGENGACTVTIKDSANVENAYCASESGESSGSGIGSGKNGAGTVTIENGANVKNAYCRSGSGESSGAGIGSGKNGTGNVSITGGTILGKCSAEGTTAPTGAGIGGGQSADVTVSIANARVEGWSLSTDKYLPLGAGIGVGQGGKANVTIDSGNVIARCVRERGDSNVDFEGAAIGVGKDGNVKDSKVIINGGNVDAKWFNTNYVAGRPAVKPAPVRKDGTPVYLTEISGLVPDTPIDAASAINTMTVTEPGKDAQSRTIPYNLTGVTADSKGKLWSFLPADTIPKDDAPVSSLTYTDLNLRQGTETRTGSLWVHVVESVQQRNPNPTEEIKQKSTVDVGSDTTAPKFTPDPAEFSYTGQPQAPTLVLSGEEKQAEQYYYTDAKWTKDNQNREGSDQYGVIAQRKGGSLPSRIAKTGYAIKKAASTLDVYADPQAITYGDSFTLVAKPAIKPAENRSASAKPNTVDFYLGDSAAGKLLGTAEVENTGAEINIDKTNPYYPDAGQVTFTAVYGGSGSLENSTGTATLTVDKAAITGVTFEDATFTEDGAEHKIEVTGELPQGITVAYENNIQKVKGTYTAKAMIDGGANYKSLTLTATLTIKAGNPYVTQPPKTPEEATAAIQKLPGANDYDSLSQEEKEQVKEALDKIAGGIGEMGEEAQYRIPVEDLEKLGALYEKVYKGIVEKDTSAAEGLKNYVPGENIQVSGAAMAAKAMGGDVKVTITQDVSPEGAAMAFTMELFLKRSGESDYSKVQLSTPIIIRIVLPEGINTEGLTIRHIKGDGTVEILIPEIKDGVATFMTASFSNFLFVEAEPSEPGTTPEPDPGTKPEPGKKPEAPPKTSQTGSSSSVKTPNTGDAIGTIGTIACGGLVFSGLLILVIIVMRKQRNRQ